MGGVQNSLGLVTFPLAQYAVVKVLGPTPSRRDRLPRRGFAETALCPAVGDHYYSSSIPGGIVVPHYTRGHFPAVLTDTRKFLFSGASASGGRFQIPSQCMGQIGLSITQVPEQFIFGTRLAPYEPESCTYRRAGRAFHGLPVIKDIGVSGRQWRVRSVPH